jgi:predicted 3-demethylubiquinone-9 3-methyltransferase (glyoxalase superfamily)
MKKITPFLWFDTQAEEAMNFYISVFPNSKALNISRYPEGSPGPAGQVMVASFEINGTEFTALNGGPQFKFTEAISFVVNCDNQEEVDNLWTKLTADGGEESQCGWLKDKYGLSWQIIPKQMGELMSNPDPATSQRVMQAMLQMKKIDIKKLEEARDRS